MKQKVRALIKFVLIHGGIGVVFFEIFSWLPISVIDWIEKQLVFFLLLAFVNTALTLPFLCKYSKKQTKFRMYKPWLLWLSGILLCYTAWLVYFAVRFAITMRNF